MQSHQSMGGEFFSFSLSGRDFSIKPRTVGSGTPEITLDIVF